MDAIEVRGFSFSYPGSEAPAVQDASLTVQTGEYVVLCGKSGSGKTTLLRSIKKEIAPVGRRTGTILINGKDVLPVEESARTIGFVMQDPDNQIVTDTVWHELAFGLENLGIGTETIRRRVAETAHFFGIQSWFEKSVFELSGGQKQILNLAAAIAMQTDVVILDEPTAQLDPIAAKEFLQMLHRVNDELGKTVLLSEHRLDDVLPACDTVVYMDTGRIYFAGAPGEFVGFLGGNENESIKEYSISLPVPARIAARLGEVRDIPLTVKEGRNWLKDFSSVAKLCRSDGEPWEREDVLLQAKDIWYRYNKQDDFALQGLNLEIGRNEIHCIVGGNGSGKSTFLGVAAGVFKPARGKVQFADTLKTGMLSQNPKTLFVCDSLREDLREHEKGIAEESIQEIIHLFGLGGLLARHPYDLSGGEMQKAALAKLLLLDPDLLLLDEPVKGLDAFAKSELGAVLKQLQKRGKTIVIVTHDLEFAAQYANRVSMMFLGNVIAEDSAKEFLYPIHFTQRAQAG